MKASQDLIDYIEDLRKEAASVRSTRREVSGLEYVDTGKFNGLMAGCRLLVAKLGPFFGKVWDEMLQPPSDNRKSSFDKINGVLDSIASALAKGRLATIEEVVSAEVLGDLLEHAEELLRSRFNLAAAIILRAVLGERLRKLCASNGCVPNVQRPTVENFKQSLYAAQVIDKIVVKDINWMAGECRSPSITRIQRRGCAATLPASHGIPISLLGAVESVVKSKHAAKSNKTPFRVWLGRRASGCGRRGHRIPSHAGGGSRRCAFDHDRIRR
jgi:hypothetical protein